jgi:hypothetical protein
MDFVKICTKVLKLLSAGFQNCVVNTFNEINLCTLYHEHFPPFSYSSFTHYILATNCAVIDYEFQQHSLY